MATAKTTAEAATKTDPAKAPVHLVCGTDEFLVAANAKKLVDRLCPADQQALGLEIIDGDCDTIDESVAAINATISAVQTVGFFGSTKVVWLRDASFLSEAEPGRFEDVKKKLGELTDEIKGGLIKGQYLVISSTKVHRGKAYYKACQAVGAVHEHNVPEKPRDAEAHAREVAAVAFDAAGLKAGQDVQQAFLARCGTDTRQITLEIDKLRSSLGARTQVTRDDVRRLVSPSREAVGWDLIDAFARRNLGAAVQLLRQLTEQKESAIGMIASLASRIRDLIVLRECMDRRWARIGGGGWKKEVEWSIPPEGDALIASIGKDVRKQHPYRLFLLAEQAQTFTVPELIRCQQLVVETHEAMVTGAVDDALLLETMLVRSIGGQRRAP
ncbi:MAG: DNA polymerase III subunit delta [bacterium]